MPRTFSIPFNSDDKNDDYLELFETRSYNSTFVFNYGVENIQTGNILTQQNINGTSNILDIYLSLKKLYANDTQPNAFFLEKVVESSL